ncbi:MAG: hypothetical protein ACRYFX_16130 [Janthinobacterium lividum]
MRVLVKQKIYTEQMFIGHVGFKTTKNLARVIDEARSKIEPAFQNYLKAYEEDNPAGIFLPAMHTTDEYDLDVSQYYMGPTHEQQWNTNKYHTLVTFSAKPKLTTVDNARLSIEAKRRKSVRGANDSLYDKIRAKRKQHQDFKGNKVYFIELDSTFSHNPNNPILPPIAADQIDFQPYKQLIEKDSTTILAFVFKKVTEHGVERRITWLYQPEHEALVDALRRVV